MKRIIFICAAVALAVVAIAVPASAVTIEGVEQYAVVPPPIDIPTVGAYNYSDYVSHSDKVGTYERCYLDMNQILMYSELWGTPEGYMGLVTNNSAHTFTLPDDNSYRIINGAVFGLARYAFPGSDNTYAFLQLNNIPSGSYLNVGLRLYSSLGFVSTGTATLSLTYYDEVLHEVKSDVVNGSMGTAGTVSFGSYMIDKPSSAMYLSVKFVINNFAFNETAGRVELEFEDPFVSIDIDTSFRTNDLVGDIDQGIGDLNDKLDEIINGLYNPISPDMGDIEGVENGEAGLRGQASVGLNLGVSFIDDVGTLVSSLAVGFTASAKIFNGFAEIPFIRNLLIFSLAIGSFGAILGISLAVSKSKVKDGGGK